MSKKKKKKILERNAENRRNTDKINRILKRNIQK